MSFSKLQTCAGEEGVLGLGFSQVSSHNFPTTLSNMKNSLRHPIFSIYLNGGKDDYPKEVTHPTMAHSELVFGGVNQRHYEGCLTWHDLGQFEDDTGKPFEGYWDFRLDDVQVGGRSLQSTDLGIVDSGSTYVIGPSADVGAFAEMNKAMCFLFNSEGEIDEESMIKCDYPAGFDIAVVDCSQPFYPLELFADGAKYSLDKDDLVLEVSTEDGPLCVLRMNGSEENPAWVLGDAFFNRYYAAFDFVKKRVGFAKAAENSADECTSDLHLDISTSQPPNRGHHKVPIGLPASPHNEDSSHVSIDAPPMKDHEITAKATDSGKSHKGTHKFGLAVFGLFAVCVVAFFLFVQNRRKRTRLNLADFSELTFAEQPKAGDVEMT
mmetsp:Transcript_51541/g.154744  ORF Transcript_51541/g.154744 Transcript_51541/m.154744 type:complete len:379 (-) Transcript_51541:34-1170(-)